MKRKIIALLIFTLLLVAGCSNKPKIEDNNKSITEENINAKKSETNKNDKTFSAGEEAIIKDKNGNEMYSLKVDSVKVANDFEYKEDFSENANQIVEVDYTYKNIAQDEVALYIHGSNLQVVDESGKAAENSDMYVKQRPQEAGVGIAVTVQSYYGLENESNEVRVILRSETYKETIIFKVPVE